MAAVTVTVSAALARGSLQAVIKAAERMRALWHQPRMRLRIRCRGLQTFLHVSEESGLGCCAGVAHEGLQQTPGSTRLV